MDSQDLTFEKQIQRLQKKIDFLEKEAQRNADAANKAKAEFLSNMRHDIRTPLSGIMGFSELLKTETSEPRIKEYADNLVASSSALLSLLDEILETVRVSTGDVPAQKKKFDLHQLFQHIEALYKARALEKQLKLSLIWDETLPNFVIGDKIRIHRIILELVANALKFTNKGFVSIRVELAKKQGRNFIMKLIVHDSGIGISQENQQDIYLQFKRLTPSYQGIYKGPGLGLYVVKQFIDDLAGEIYVASELHKGTSFTCIIPLQEPLLNDEQGVDKEQIAIPTYLEPTAAMSQNSKTRVLIVEDNRIAQSVARALLTNLSCQVDIAANSYEALEYYERTVYDLIFMDIGLGEGMDGYEITQKIRSKEDDDHHTPIVALTAHALDESRQRGIESGIDAVLTKPLTRAQAINILKTFVPARIAYASPPASKIQADLPAHSEELFQLEQFPLLDYKLGLKNCGTNCMLVELLTLMITQELPADFEQMKNAFAKKNYDVVERIAHKIKGGAVYVGTTRMKYACQYLERYWKTGAREHFDSLYHQAIRIIDETFVHLADWLKKTM
ncbi:response regulator [Legionella lytica]|uniref:histidine kinase n=1 Tax=Legionella lytica TaxID=96232 RepID=A0ABY4Y7H5_9GAMM|nr:response regulator [Legionella lytica]USQ13571.1 response regulator [Legionella lytica]